MKTIFDVFVRFSIKQWCLSHPRHVTSPLEVYTVRADKRLMRSVSPGGQTVQQQPYLYPRLDKGGEEGDFMTASSCSSLDFSPRYFLFIFFIGVAAYK